MNEIKTNKRTVTISEIRGTAPRPGSTQPGNFIVNKTLWVNRGEFRNMLLGMNLNPELPPTIVVGRKMTYEELVVTQEAIDAGIAAGDKDRNGKTGYVHTVNGRTVAYNKPGVNNINVSIDLGDKFKDMTALEIIQASVIMPRVAQPQPARPVTAPAQKETIDEDPDGNINDQGKDGEEDLKEAGVKKEGEDIGDPIKPVTTT